jgi:uncharacterized protein YxeA
MKKNVIIYAALAVVIIIGCWYFLLRDESSGAPITQNEVQGVEVSVQSEDSAVPSQVSMRDLVARGQSLECTFDLDVEYSKSSGTVYIADGKVRGNFDIVVSMSAVGTQKFEAYMIADGEMSYVWSSLIKQGFKIPISESETASNPQNGVDYNQKLNYSCKPWNADASFFVPPADITFSAAPTALQQ